MALLMYEGFDYETTTPGADFQTGSLPAWGYNGWTGAGTITIAGQLGGKALNLQNNNHWVQWQISTPTAGPYIFGYRYQHVTLSGVVNGTIYFLDSASAIQCGLGFTAANNLFFWRGTVANVVATGTTTIPLGTWFTVEVQFTVSTTVGAVKVILNGNNASPEINVTGVNTQATGNANVGFINIGGPSNNGGNGNAQQYIDDFYFLDATGPAPYNTFLSVAGLWQVETLFVTSNNSVAFTPNTSTNASQVQEVNSDNDTTFNTCSAAAIDTFNHGSLSTSPSVIFAAAVVAKMRKDDVTNQQGRTKLISGGTTANGTSHLLNTSYQYLEDYYITDPNTGLAWTASNINASKIGYERTT